MDDSPQFDISPAEIDRLPNQEKQQLQQWLMTESQKNAVQKCKIYFHPHTPAPWFSNSLGASRPITTDISQLYTNSPKHASRNAYPDRYRRASLPVKKKAAYRIVWRGLWIVIWRCLNIWRHSEPNNNASDLELIRRKSGRNEAPESSSGDLSCA